MEEIDTQHIAEICHEANRAYCITRGDLSQKPWGHADDWQKESAIKGVKFALEHPFGHPSGQHDAWSKDKLASGWKFGPVKDAEKKEHPCLVPWSELPSAQKRKDVLFKAIVFAMTIHFDALESDVDDGGETEGGEQ